MLSDSLSVFIYRCLLNVKIWKFAPFITHAENNNYEVAETSFTIRAMTTPARVKGATTCICQDDVEATRMLI